jgi:polysaccharide pyruvyl transferase WcaK-like protein
LLTPYNGGNLGDAAIQDAVIANLRLRLPEARFSGISLNCENFVERHGVGAFPLCVTERPFYAMSCGRAAAKQNQENSPAGNQNPWAVRIKGTLKRLPGLVKLLGRIRRWALTVPREIVHFARGYRFLRSQDLLIVSGGGQLDEEWGGPWGHPFALFKWALLARMARVPCAFLSIGAGKVLSPISRLFLSVALRLACYRSYRDEKSRGIAATLLKAAAKDPVVPDLAFSLPVSVAPAGADVRSLSRGRMVVAISPIAYAKPGSWPRQDQANYERYVQQMARVIALLLQRGCFLVIVWSSIGDDERVIPEILGQLDDESKGKLSGQICVPNIATWQDFTATLLGVDLLIASRLHSAILGFVAHIPTVSISFDAKVDWLMNDVGQTGCLLQIRDFMAEDVLKVIDRIQLRRSAAVDQIISYQERILPDSKRQYDALAGFAGLHYSGLN